MSEPHVSDVPAPGASREDARAVLFVQLVMQQANLAMLYLGKTPHPESGQSIQNLDAARMLIDQLEVLEAKTKGNLDKEEAAILKQSLMSLRLAFVEAVESPGQPQTESKLDAASAATQPVEGAHPAAAAEDEHRKKFSKKY
jgi:hypothetical protein